MSSKKRSGLPQTFYKNIVFENLCNDFSLAKETHRPLLIVGGGASNTYFDPCRIPTNPVIFRLNMFMLEPDYRFGSHVDAVFWAIHRRILHTGLEVSIQNKFYSVNHFFRPSNLMNSSLSTFRDVSAKHVRLFQPKFWHWDLFHQYPEFDEFFFNRKHGGLPTIGLQALATGLILGFRDIYLTGFDFYKSSIPTHVLNTKKKAKNNRYFYNIPDFLKPLIAKAHIEKNYEHKSHSEKIDILFFKMLSRLFADAKIFCAVPESPLLKLTRMAPFCKDHFIPKPEGGKKDIEKFYSIYKRALYRKQAQMGEVWYQDEKLIGWAWDSRRPSDTPILQFIGDDGQLLAEFSPSSYLHDLDTGGVGQAMHGFVSYINKRPNLARNKQLKICFKDGCDLSGSPIDLSRKKENISRSISDRKIYVEAVDLIKKSGYFDEEWYLSYYPWVIRLNVDPVEHYLFVGASLKYNPSRKFSTLDYINKHELNDEENPLIHYIESKMGFNVKPQAYSKKKPSSIQDDTKSTYLRHPNRRASGRKNIKSLSRGVDHFWYDNSDSRFAIKSLKEENTLPAGIKKILVVAHNFNLSTGVSRPISHYLNVMSKVNDIEVVSIEVEDNESVFAIEADIKSHDFTILNSMAFFSNYKDSAILLNRCENSRFAIYLHETEWGFEAFKKNLPRRYQEFCKVAPKCNFFCVSQKQADFLKSEFGIEKTHVIYNTTILPVQVQFVPVIQQKCMNNMLRVVMAGTIQPRKGIDLFSKVADLAFEQGLPWSFHWAGQDTGQEGYKSKHVEFLGSLEGDTYFQFLNNSDIFLLSSIDDPFPLSSLEALQLNKKLVLYKASGISEVIRGISGLGVFNEHNADSAFIELKRVIAESLDVEAIASLNARFSVARFVRRINFAIGDIVKNI